MFGVAVAADIAAGFVGGLDRYPSKWSAEIDGDPMETPTSWLQPVRFSGQAAMLKALKPGSDEQNAAALLRYYDGRGAVRLFEADENAL